MLLDVLTDGVDPVATSPSCGAAAVSCTSSSPTTHGRQRLSRRRRDGSDGSEVRDGRQPLGGDSAMYAQFQDEYAFIGDHKIDMRTFDLGARPRTAPSLGNEHEPVRAAARKPARSPAASASTRGLAIWAHQAEPDTRGPEVGFHFPRSRAHRTSPTTGLLSLLIHETLETTTDHQRRHLHRAPGRRRPARRLDLTFTFDDILTFAPAAAVRGQHDVRGDLAGRRNQGCRRQRHRGLRLHVLDRLQRRRQPAAGGHRLRPPASYPAAPDEAGDPDRRQRKRSGRRLPRIPLRRGRRQRAEQLVVVGRGRSSMPTPPRVTTWRPCRSRDAGGLDRDGVRSR